MSTDGSLASTVTNPPAASAGLTPATFVADGPYSPRRPKLEEILANRSHPPWTLSAFWAYCSQNHCLENLEFIKDAKRYCELHHTAVDIGQPADPIATEQLLSHWHRLTQTYIRPGSPREVNLIESVRQPLLSAPTAPQPPHPHLLDLAIQKILELIQDSILFPFFNEVRPFSQFDEHADLTISERQTSPHPRPHTVAVDQLAAIQSSYIPPPQSQSQSHRHTSVPSNTVYPRSGVRSAPPREAFSSVPSHSSTASGETNLTDDNSSVSSPGPSDVMTPPATPPTGELHYRERHTSSRTNSREAWKSLGSRLGLRRRSGSNLRRDDHIHEDDE